jgi:hypothetical protein
MIESDPETICLESGVTRTVVTVYEYPERHADFEVIHSISSLFCLLIQKPKIVHLVLSKLSKSNGHVLLEFLPKLYG